MENNNTTNVNIVDVKIPFLSMVVLMVTTAIAAIPAFIILAVLGVMLAGMITGINN